MRGLFGILILLAVVHIALVEFLAVNVIANCTSTKPEDAAICSCMKNTLRLSYEPEKSLFSMQPVDMNGIFQMCRSPKSAHLGNG